MSQETIHERFDRHFTENMRREIEMLKRSDFWKRMCDPDTHDEWRRLNERSDK